MPLKERKLARLETLFKLETLQKLADKALNKEDVVRFIEAIVKLIKDTQKRNLDEFNAIHGAVDLLSKRVKDDAVKDVEELKGQVNKEMSKMEKDMEKMHREQADGMNFIRDKMRSIKPAKDGRDGVDGKNGVDGKDAPPVDEEKLVEAIVKKIPAPTRIQTPAKSYQIRKADVSSQCDGSNKTFSVGGSHFGIIGVFGTQFPQIYRPTIDFTETRTGILLTDAVGAPQSDQTLIIQFLK